MVVRLGPSFDILSRVVEEYESRGQTVQHVEVQTTSSTGGRLDALVHLPVSFCPVAGTDASARLEPMAATPAGRDGVRIEFSTPVLDGLEEATANAVTARVRETTVTDDGVVLTVELRIDPDGDDEETETEAAEQTAEMAANEETAETAEMVGTAKAEEMGAELPASTRDDDRDPTLAERLAAVRDESLPPYEDTAFLERLYESCDTFAEMNRYVELDVSTETIRRYMIDADIHRAVSYATTSEPPHADADERVPAETISLPDGLTTEDLVAAVCASVTVYQVQQRLGLDRATTRGLLADLDLFEFVLHRIGDDRSRESSSEEVLRRIEESAARERDDPPTV